MAGNYAQLLDIINNPTDHSLPAWDNNNKLIEGLTVKQYLLTIINSLTVGYQFMGVASTDTSGGTPDQNVFYLAGAGTYNGFGSNPITIDAGYIGIIRWNGAWSSEPIKISDVVSVSQNTETGHTDINIGSESFPVASISDIESTKSISDSILALDFSNPTVGKYYNNDGTTTSDASWSCKEIDISKFKGMVAVIRLGFHIGDEYYYTNNSFIETTNDEIVDISTYIKDNISLIDDCVTIQLPSTASKLLASWAIDPRYSIVPFVSISRLPIYNYEIGDKVESMQQEVAKLATNSESFGYFDFSNANQHKKYDSSGNIVDENSYACKEFDVSNFTGKLLILRAGFVYLGENFYLNDSYVKTEDDTVIPITSLQFNGFTIPFDGSVIKLPNDADKLLLSWAIDERYLVKPYCYIPYALTELMYGIGISNKVDYIAIGDSITDGTGASAALGSYAKRLDTYFNFGQFAQLAAGGMSSVRQSGSYSSYPLLKDYVSQVSNFKGIISVSIGTNDYGNGHSPLGTLDQIKNVAYANLRPTPSTYDATYTFAEGFRYDLETLKRNNPDAIIVVLSPISRVGELTEYITDAPLQAYRDMEKDICDMLGIIYIDMRNCGIARWNASPVWSNDNLHPNDYGYYLMTSYLIPRFKEFINQQQYLNEMLS